jgi:hypothetical protein
MQRIRVSVFTNTGNADLPFDEKPSSSFLLGEPGIKKGQHTLLRDAPVVADWNGDGVADLVIGKGQDNQVLILLGGRQGLSPERTVKIALDYRLHYETGLHVADFDGDGLQDLACFGCTSTGVGSNGPMAVYLWMRPTRP